MRRPNYFLEEPLLQLMNSYIESSHDSYGACHFSREWLSQIPDGLLYTERFITLLCEGSIKNIWLLCNTKINYDIFIQLLPRLTYSEKEQVDFVIDYIKANNCSEIQIMDIMQNISKHIGKSNYWKRNNINIGLFPEQYRIMLFNLVISEISNAPKVREYIQTNRPDDVFHSQLFKTVISEVEDSFGNEDMDNFKLDGGFWKTVLESEKYFWFICGKYIKDIPDAILFAMVQHDETKPILGIDDKFLPMGMFFDEDLFPLLNKILEFSVANNCYRTVNRILYFICFIKSGAARSEYLLSTVIPYEDHLDKLLWGGIIHNIKSGYPIENIDIVRIDI